MYESGIKNTAIELNNKYKYINPKWSPKGNEVAFLSIYEGKYFLYIYSVKTGSTRKIIGEKEYSGHINGFCWSAESVNIIFTSINAICREIYIIDTNSLKVRQITRGNGIYSSFAPKCSTNANKIAFLRCYSGLTDLWVCSFDAKDFIKISSCGFVKSFDWLNINDFIAFIKGNDGKADDLCIVDVNDKETKNIDIDSSIYNMKRVRSSTGGSYIAFIGSNLYTDDIYMT